MAVEQVATQRLPRSEAGSRGVTHTGIAGDLDVLRFRTLFPGTPAACCRPAPRGHYERHPG